MCIVYTYFCLEYTMYIKIIISTHTFPYNKLRNKINNSSVCLNYFPIKIINK